ncbi:colicin-like pore-forming protein [Pseudomonas shirazensis]
MQINLPATFVGAQPPAGNDPYGIGFNVHSFQFGGSQASTHMAYAKYELQDANRGLAKEIGRIEAEVKKTFAETSKGLDQHLSNQLTAVGATTANAASNTVKIEKLITSLGEDRAVALEKANAFFGSNPLTISMKVKASKLRVAGHPRGYMAMALRIQTEYGLSYAEAHKVLWLDAAIESMSKRLAEERVKAQQQREAEAKRLAEEKAKAEAEADHMAAVKFVVDFYGEVTDKFGKQLASQARELEQTAQGKRIRSAAQAIKAFDQYREGIQKKFGAVDRAAIATALKAMDKKQMSENLARFAKGFGLTGVAMDGWDLGKEVVKGLETDNWNPFFLKAETLAAGALSGFLLSAVFSLTVGIPAGAAGILAFASLMVIVSAAIDEKQMKKFNDFILSYAP